MKINQQTKANVVMFVVSLLPPLIINCSITDSFFPFQFVNFILIVWCACRIFSFDNKPISSDTITYLFIYIFLGIAPLYQFSAKALLWGGAPIKDTDYFYATIILLGGILIYDMAYRVYYYSKRHLRQSKSSTHAKSLQLSNTRALILSTLSLVITLYAYKDYPILLILREYNEDVKIVFDAFSNTSLNLIYTIVIRPIPIVVLMYYNIISKKQCLFSYILLFIVLITNFPLSLPRFYVAGLYLPLMFTYYRHLIYKPLLIKFIFIFGILFVFPFLNQGRTVTSISELEVSIIPDYEMFLTGHFDTFQNGLRVIRDNYVTYGEQLLGVILFGFPRSIWPGKPIGSGGVIAEEFGLTFDHIALNYWAEGWINFGLIGIVLFSIILGKINATFDIKFYKRKPSICYMTIYFIYLGMLFFILRGDLISCVAYMVGLSAATYGCSKLIIHKSR